MAKKTNEYGFEEFEGGHGKKQNQKLKPYLVLQYLLRQSDENHVISAEKIVAYLQEICGIYAERRSIYRDIDEINKAMLIVEEEIDVHEAEERIAEDESEKLVVYDKSKKGFYVRQRHYDPHDIRLLAECVYSAKFLSAGQAERLANVVCEFVSEEQAKTIKHDAFLTDRVKTDNRSVLNNISTINDAMSKYLEGRRHEPEKITFQYLKYSIKDVGQQVERRKGMKYTVSPYKLLINDGNYYLLAFDDYAQDMRTYRVDRMAYLGLTDKPREGQDALAEHPLENYQKQTFSMYGGDVKHVTLRVSNWMMGAIIDKFGRQNYAHPVDDRHFEVTVSVAISPQFYGWVFGLKNYVTIVSPQDVVEGMKEHLRAVMKRYERKL